MEDSKQGQLDLQIKVSKQIKKLMKVWQKSKKLEDVEEQDSSDKVIWKELGILIDLNAKMDALRKELAARSKERG